MERCCRPNMRIFCADRRDFFAASSGVGFFCAPAGRGLFYHPRGGVLFPRRGCFALRAGLRPVAHCMPRCGSAKLAEERMVLRDFLLAAGGERFRSPERPPFWSAKKEGKSRLEPAVLRTPFSPLYCILLSPARGCRKDLITRPGRYALLRQGTFHLLSPQPAPAAAGRGRLDAPAYFSMGERLSVCEAIERRSLPTRPCSP